MKWLGHVRRVKQEDSIQSLKNREIARRREKELAQRSTKQSRGLKKSRTKKCTKFILLPNLNYICC